MRILILGASGYAGACIKENLEKGNSSVFGTYRTNKAGYERDKTMLYYSLDDRQRLAHILQELSPDVIISCLTGEFGLQLEAHRMAAEFLNANGGRMIYLSTSNVFDGALDAVHYETDQPSAESGYGKFKMQCEELLQSVLGESCVIIRIPEIWGSNCPRLIKLVESVQNSVPIHTYKNLYVNYTTNLRIAEWISCILNQGLKGVFHAGTDDIYEYAAFHEELINALHLGTPVFETVMCETPLYQAVLPGRDESPASCRFRVQDVIRDLAEDWRTQIKTESTAGTGWQLQEENS